MADIGNFGKPEVGIYWSWDLWKTRSWKIVIWILINKKVRKSGSWKIHLSRRWQSVDLPNLVSTMLPPAPPWICFGPLVSSFLAQCWRSTILVVLAQHYSSCALFLAAAFCFFALMTSLCLAWSTSLIFCLLILLQTLPPFPPCRKTSSLPSLPSNH